MDDAIWVAEKDAVKAKLDWQEDTKLMVDLKFKPALLGFYNCKSIAILTFYIHWKHM